jgi:antitoxin PrlF
MPVATMTSKGQITVPKEIRDELGLETGTRLWFVRTPEGFVLRPASNSVMRLSGILKYDGPPLTPEEIEQRMAEGLAEKFLP